MTDHRGWRITVFATNTLGGQLADLELRHRSAGPRRGPHPRPQRHRDIFGSPSDIASVWAGRNVILDRGAFGKVVVDMM